MGKELTEGKWAGGSISTLPSPPLFVKQREDGKRFECCWKLPVWKGKMRQWGASPASGGWNDYP